MTDETSEYEPDDDFDADLEADFGADFAADAPQDQTGDFDEDHAIAEAERAMAEARARLADVPAEVVVTNHVMGLYELAAIHLSATPPDLTQGALAIDAVGCLVEGLGDRLGDDAPTMRDALNNIRIAFVQIKGQMEGSGDAPG